MAICPRCMENKSKLSHMSRFGNYRVCSQCSKEEILEAKLRSKQISKSQYDEAVVELNTIYSTVV